MTTICFCLNRRAISCDSRITADGEIITDEADKRTVFNDVEFFLAGSLADRDTVCKAFTGRRRKIRSGIDMQALAWDGVTLWDITASDGELSWHPVCSDRGAIGSGSPYAASALHDGKTPRQAVMAAKRHDTGTGGKVVTHKLRSRV
ncbi:MAG: hypothetical protein V4628_11610 [Pseudomonadota bacterium]